MAIDATLRIVFALGLCAAANFAAAQPAPKPPESRSCLPFTMMRYAYDGDFDRALAYSEQCVSAHMHWVDPHGNLVLDSGDPHGWERAASGGWVLVFLCANAQLHAMAGEISQAQDELHRAERFERFYQGFRSFLVADGWRYELMGVTRGFILERNGQLGESSAAYRTADSSGAGRMAAVALAARDDMRAAMWTRMAGETPTSWAVAGALAEIRGDETTAFVMYFESDAAMRQALRERPNGAQLPLESRSPAAAGSEAKPGSLLDFQPLLFAERSRVAKALDRLGPRKRAAAQPSGILRSEQEALNRWLRERMRNSVPGIGFRPQYPGFFFGFTPEDRQAIRRHKVAAPAGHDPSILLYLPQSVAVTSLLDRDTLAIDFYHLSAELLSVAAEGGVAPSQLVSTDQPGGASPERLALLSELRKAYGDLAGLYRVIQEVPLSTAGGRVHTAPEEARLYAQWQPDFATAHLGSLTADLAKSIEDATSRARARLGSARRYIP